MTEDEPNTIQGWAVRVFFALLFAAVTTIVVSQFHSTLAYVAGGVAFVVGLVTPKVFAFLGDLSV